MSAPSCDWCRQRRSLRWFLLGSIAMVAIDLLTAAACVAERRHVLASLWVVIAAGNVVGALYFRRALALLWERRDDRDDADRREPPNYRSAPAEPDRSGRGGRRVG